MFQKIQKKLKEFFGEKGQGVVEYALVLGFVAVLAIYLLTGSNVTKDVEANIANVDSAASDISAEYAKAKAGTANTGKAS